MWEVCLLDGPSLGRQKSPRYRPSLQYPCPGLYPTTLPTFLGLYWCLLSDLTENVSAWSGSSVTLGPKSKVGLLQCSRYLLCFGFILSPLIHSLSTNWASVALWGDLPHFSVSAYMLVGLSFPTSLFSPSQNEDSTLLATVTIWGTCTWSNWWHLQGLLWESTTCFSDPGRM